MLNRRLFLVNCAGFAGLLLFGCTPRNVPQVLILSQSIPPQLLSRFEKISSESNLKFQAIEQISDLFKLLEKWQQSSDSQSDEVPILFWRNNQATPANLLTIGDFWLAEAIQKNLIQPLEVEDLNGWVNIPTKWQKIVQRNQQGLVDPDGRIWGAPYRWGTAMIVYRQDRLAQIGLSIADWQDLWQPEISSRLSLPDHYREVIGLTLKRLGYSYNTSDLSEVDQLRSQLKALHRQVKFYSSDDYLQPLILGDTWVAVGWSTDILPVLSRYRNRLAAVVPQSGTSLWADVWVKPRQITDEFTTAVREWINFCWEVESAELISLFTEAASPVVLSLPKTELPENLEDNSLLIPPEPILEKSEFIYPLPKEVSEDYLELWLEVRG